MTTLPEYTAKVRSALLPYFGIDIPTVPDAWFEHFHKKDYNPERAAVAICKALQHPIIFTDGTPF